MTRPLVGILAMQGAFREHARLLGDIGVRTCDVRSADQLESVDALVIPGGESTAIRKLLASSRLDGLLRARLEEGMPALGTCAGLIVLARCEPDGAPPTLGLLDADVERNGYGRQIHSFEARVELRGDLADKAEGGASCAPADKEPAEPTADAGRMHGVFIRAPRISGLGEGVEVLGVLEGSDDPVIIRQGNLIGATFHPELAGEVALHRMLIESCVEGAAVGRAQ